MHRRILSAALLLGAACATTPKTAETVETRERIANRSPFDIAYCHPGTGVPMPATATAPGNRRRAADHRAAGPGVPRRSGEPRRGGGDHRHPRPPPWTRRAPRMRRSGENLTDAGRACITRKLEEAVRLPPVAEGKPAVKGEIKVVHRQGREPHGDPRAQPAERHLRRHPARPAGLVRLLSGRDRDPSHRPRGVRGAPGATGADERHLRSDERRGRRRRAGGR